jgi:hypothetical protein
MKLVYEYSKEIKKLFPKDAFQCQGYFAAALQAESKEDKLGAELNLKRAIEAEEASKNESKD